jgi:hypothetical protein
MIDAAAFEHNDNFTLHLVEDEQYSLFEDKFKAKKTTDDCYTPPEVYNVIRDWACEEYDIDPTSIVRPFYPGGDYERFTYPDGCTVLDNPPFSILSKICEFYLDKNINFFLFAPSLTCFSGRKTLVQMNHLICDCNIIYDNGACVRTSFVSNYGGDIVAQTCPDLTQRVNDTVARLRKEKVKQLPKYEYPDHIVTAAIMQRWAKYGVNVQFRRNDCAPISWMDAQREQKKSIFGGGLLLSDKAAAERAAAERAAAEKWKLSDRELAIVEHLSKR